MTDELTLTTERIEQFIKDNPGITVKEIAWKVAGDKMPDDQTRRAVAATAYSLSTRTSDPYVRQGHKYYAPGAEPELVADKEKFEGLLHKAATTQLPRKEAVQSRVTSQSDSQPTNSNAQLIEDALRAYVWDTGADVKPLHDFLDWYELNG